VIGFSLYMAGPYTLLHPRKLYAQIRECASASDRAHAVLECLSGATGARSGFLLLFADRQLEVAAATAGGAPPAGLMEEARRAWSEQSTSVRSDNTTMDVRGHMQHLTPTEQALPWTDPQGGAYVARILAVHRDSQFIQVGVAMLKLDAGRPLAALRRTHVEALCNALLDAGDVRGNVQLSEPA
jgi:hypothetical protein